MASISSLSYNDEAKFIVVDEEIQAAHAEALILGWLKELRKRKPKVNIEYLLFSTSKNIHENQLKQYNLDSIKIHDYYTLTINEKRDCLSEKLPSILKEHSRQASIIIVNCLSSLAMTVGVAEASWFVEKLRTNVSKVICINRRDFGSQNIPRVDTLGTTYVKLERNSGISFKNSISYLATVTHRKPSFSLVQQTETVTQDLETYAIKAEKNVKMQRNKKEDVPEVTQAVQASFRIEMNEQELEQRKSMSLPYTAASSSKILYQPDDVDDFDEEDPDDDLCI